MVRYTEESVPIESHGLDPISLELANRLIKGFKDLNREGLDTSFSAMFLGPDMVDSLLTNKRIAVSDFDGYKFRFGIDSNRKIVLFVHREKGEIIGNEEVYKSVSDYHYVYDAENDTFHRVKMSQILSESVDDGVTLKLIPMISAEYKAFKGNFDRQLEITKALSTIFVVESQGDQGERPPVPAFYYSIVGYFLGLGILRHIRPYDTNRGIKIFFGYGPSRENSSFSNFHLIVINAENADEDINRHNGRIWATYDVSQPLGIYEVAEGQSGIPPWGGIKYIISGGSSCVRPEEKETESDG